MKNNFQNDIHILLAVPFSDCHAVTNRLLDLDLRLKGYKVKNIGVNSSARDIAAAMHIYNPDLTLITCQNGHAKIDLRELGGCLDQFSLKGKPIWIGGKLNINNKLSSQEKRWFIRQGLTHVFPPESTLDDLYRKITEPYSLYGGSNGTGLLEKSF